MYALSGQIYFSSGCHATNTTTSAPAFSSVSLQAQALFRNKVKNAAVFHEGRQIVLKPLVLLLVLLPCSLTIPLSMPYHQAEPKPPHPQMRIGLLLLLAPFLLLDITAAGPSISQHAFHTRPFQTVALHLSCLSQPRRLSASRSHALPSTSPSRPADPLFSSTAALSSSMAQSTRRLTSSLFGSPSETTTTTPNLPQPPKRKESGEHFWFWFTTQAFLMPEIRPVTLLNMALTTLVALAFKRSVFRPLDIHPHSLLAGPLGFFLTFRAQEGVDRCREAGKAWDSLLDTSRDMSRCIIGAEILLMSEEYPFPAQRLMNLTCAYGIVLEEFVSRVPREEELGELLSERDFLVLDKRCNHRPLAMTEIIAQEVAHLAKELKDFRESPYLIRFLINIDRLGHHITEVRRLTKTPVPPIFYTHALRFLTLWLFTLPFALVDKLPMRALIPTMGLMTWILFGLRELGIKAQYPFSTGLVHLKTLWKEVVFDARISLEMKEKKEEGQEEVEEGEEKEKEKKQARC